MAHKFDPAKWERLLSEERRALLDAGAFIRRLAIPSGAAVADLGAGPGFFTDALAEAVGPSGHVHALDVSPEMVELLRRRDLAPQVTVQISEESRTPLADASIDVALLAFVLHELDAPMTFLSEARRVISRGGRLVVLEWVPLVEAMGPPLRERMSIDLSRETLRRAGFALLDEGLANGSNYFISTVRT